MATATPHRNELNGKRAAEKRSYFQHLKWEARSADVGTIRAGSSADFRKQGHKVKAEHWKSMKSDPVLPDRCAGLPEWPGLPVNKSPQESWHTASLLLPLIPVISHYGIWYDPFHLHLFRGLAVTYSFVSLFCQFSGVGNHDSYWKRR
jgi:hypothetical protein